MSKRYVIILAAIGCKLLALYTLLLICGICLFWLALAGFGCSLENLIFKSGKRPKRYIISVDAIGCKLLAL
jgi:hypothetical protein